MSLRLSSPRVSGPITTNTRCNRKKQLQPWRNTNIGGYGSRLGARTGQRFALPGEGLAGTTSRDKREPSRLAKALACDAGRQRRRNRRGIRLQDYAAALRPLHPPARRLSFWIRQTSADRRHRCAIQPEGAGVAGVWARRRELGADRASVRQIVPAHLRSRQRPSAAIRLHRRVAVLPQELHVFAWPLRYLRLPVCDHPAACPGAINQLCAAGGIVFG